MADYVWDRLLVKFLSFELAGQTWGRDSFYEVLTGSPLMNQVNRAAGFEGADVQFIRTTSPTW